MCELLTRRRFTVEEYHRMGEAGILPEDLRLERRVKIPLYARAGVREVWLVDLATAGLEISRST
jgi:hypothetical protein